MQIRKIQPQDNLQVKQVVYNVMTSFDCVGDGFSISDPELDDMYAAYNNDKSVFYVISEGDRVLGCGGIGPLVGGDPLVCELKKMYFYPELREKGYGRKLMELCLADAKAMGYSKCYLETVERMTRANNLYNKFGFQKLSCQEGATGHGGCDTFYEKELI